METVYQNVAAVWVDPDTVSAADITRQANQKFVKVEELDKVVCRIAMHPSSYHKLGPDFVDRDNEGRCFMYTARVEFDATLQCGEVVMLETSDHEMIPLELR